LGGDETLGAARVGEGLGEYLAARGRGRDLALAAMRALPASTIKVRSFLRMSSICVQRDTRTRGLEKGDIRQSVVDIG
jgi:hypothetical protein